MRQALRSGVAAICIAGVAAPAVLASPPKPAAPTGGLDVHVAQAEGFSRIEFHWAGKGAQAQTRRDGQILTFRFGRDADPDIARLRTAPPRWIKTAETRHVGGRLELVLTLTEDADAKVGASDGATFVNVFPKPAPAAPVQTAQVVTAPAEPEPPRPNPVPAGGVVHMDSKVANGQVALSFTWANPAGAAVFRRGDAVWIVFDAAATLDISKAPRGITQFSAIQAYRGTDYSAVRIEASRDTPLFAVAEGSTWTIAFGPGQQSQPSIVRLQRDPESGPPALKAPVAGATRIIRMPDAEAGDTLTVVTALGPAKGLASRRDYVQLAFLPSVQGLAIQPYVDDLAVQREGDIVRLGRPGGLTLSPAWASQRRAQDSLGAPQAAAMPALVDYDHWPRTGEGGFLARYDALLDAATAESGNRDRDGPVAARMALARFLVGSELAFEAIGVLNDTARSHPELLENAEFRGLRGVARMMARRYKEADADFSSPALADDPSSALWRALSAARQAQWTEVRAQFAKGGEAYALFPPVWRARFARADAEAALRQDDLVGADARINLALQEKVDPLEELATRLVQARVIEAEGHKDRALRIYTAISGAPLESLSAPALLRATQIRQEQGSITPVQAAVVYDNLRYRWRGDATELEAIRALGRLYLAQGRYREALEALRSTSGGRQDLPEAVALQTDLATAFRALFLDGQADGLEPVQALALFYDFKELTPLGADGDLMVRKLVKRLVDVDLLPQAAELLKYQADNRLDGTPRAEVSTDLAVIYLMDRKPEQALQAINASRTTVLPAALTAERRLVEARAWSALGRYDSALEILGKDNSSEAQELRAEITWKQKDWAAAAPLFEKALGQRFKSPGPLSSEEEGRLLRAGVAYSLAGDTGSLARLQSRYQGFYDQAHNPEALRIALSGEPTGKMGVGDFGRVTADNEMFAGWVAKMKNRFKTARAPVGPPSRPAASAKQAQAGPGPAKG
ncbi:MAG TPA: tetratricopeptide repeat protein [Phenylobacterium sp.]|uniref:tetratricopeptide repeat protein n=1 Tax=Phenylobacterium sp. TaxID=1871053 RepID=UPI002B481906|nr:tetratricopeptide repeat protein [Phenylobacterium sp.]HKR87079.1 tetratricopeptide repeat protein [Phenylobacterium sp.]